MKNLLRWILGLAVLSHSVLAVEVEWAVDLEVTEPTLVEVVPSPDVWKAAGGDIRRMIIRDAEGRRVEAVREPSRETSREIRWIEHPAEVMQVRPLEDNRLELRCAVSKDLGPVHELDFSIPMTDFERAVRVWGVDAEGQETLLVDGGVLLDYSRYAAVRRTRLTWENNTGFHRFRVEIDGAEVEAMSATRARMVREEEGGETVSETWTRTLLRPLRIDGVTALERREVTRSGRMVLVPLEGTSWQEADGDGHDRIFDLYTGNQPVTRVTLDAKGGIFSRGARIRRSVPGGTWREVGSGTLSRLEYRDIKEENTTLEIPETHAERLRVTLAREGRRPLDVEAFHLSGLRWRLVFLAEPDRPVHLTVEDRPVSDDAPMVQRLLGEGHEPITATLKSVPAGTEPPASGFDLAGFFRGRSFFFFALAVAAGVIGLALHRAVKGMGGE